MSPVVLQGCVGRVLLAATLGQAETHQALPLGYEPETLAGDPGAPHTDRLLPPAKPPPSGSTRLRR